DHAIPAQRGAGRCGVRRRRLGRNGTGDGRTVLDGDVVRPQINTRIGRFDQLQLLGHRRQCLPLLHAFTPDQRGQVQFVLAEFAAQGVGINRPVPFALGIGVVPLTHHVPRVYEWSVSTAAVYRQEAVIHLRAAFPVTGAGVVVEPEVLAVQPWSARSREACLQPAVAVVNAADTEAGDAHAGIVFRRI